ncbi:MAG: hypothetical protein Q9205_005124 [Flavoplaca limonia]
MGSSYSCCDIAFIGNLATIDPSTPTRAPSSSSPITSSAVRPSAPSAHRRSLVTDQIYQFALGYPQTPPETSPLLKATSDSSWEKPEIIQGGMGSFRFQWDRPAGEVYVTGTFDDWAKSVKLDKEGDGFAKRVELPLNQNISYKFVVDGTWCTSTEEPQETDQDGNVNNILTSDRLSASSDKMNSAFTSGVTPESTTAKLAGDVPKESSQQPSNEATGSQTASSSDLPGTFPQTPANEDSAFSVNPIPATSGYGNPIDLQPGEKVPDPSNLTSNTISSTVKDDPSLPKSDDSANNFGVAPLPATGAFGNPINLEPGEKIPPTSHFTSNTIDTHVTTDQESYEKGSNAPVLPDVVTPQKERDSKGGSMFSVPGISKNMIPESSRPMGEGMAMEKDPGAFIQSAGANSTTAALAGAVPKEAKSTGTEKDPGAFIQSAGANSTTAALAGAVPKEAKSTGTEKDPGAFIQSAGENSTTATLAGAVPKENYGVPKIVQESQAEAGTDAEAGNNRQAVAEKTDVEKELESNIPKSAATSEGIAGGNASTSAVGGANHGSHALPASIQQSIDEMNKGSAIAPTVPDVVQESIAKSHVAPEAAGYKEMVGEKSAMESELLRKMPTEEAKGEPAPVASAALSETAPAPTENDRTTPAVMGSQNPATATTTNNSSMPAPSNNTPTTAPPPAEKSAVLGGSSTDSTTSSSTMKGAKSFPAKSSAPPPAISEPAASSSPPMTTAAAPASTPATEKAARKSSDYSREVSPMTKTDQQSKPMVTTGLGSSAAPPTSQPAPSKAAASPTSGTSPSTDKKSKRASGFFGKLKAKFSDKDKDKK